MDVSYAAKKRVVIILKLTSRPSLSLLLCSTYLQYLGPTILLRPHVLMYFFMISRTKYTKNVLVGSPVSVRDEIHCNEYPGTRRVMNVGYPGSNISTRFNPNLHPFQITLLHSKELTRVFVLCVTVQSGSSPQSSLTGSGDSGGPTAMSSHVPRPKGRPAKGGPRQIASCALCNKTFNNSSALAKHKLTHSDERKYVCNICSKAFKRQDHL